MHSLNPNELANINQINFPLLNKTKENYTLFQIN